MSQKEETLIAIQNIGVSLFAAGIIIGCMAGNVITLGISMVLTVIGFIIALICEFKIKKYKGPHAAKQEDL